MVIATELINGNGTSAIALAFFTAILGYLTVLTKLIYNQKTDIRKAEIEASKANQSATQAKENTENIGNGFARGVVARLDRTETKIDKLTENLHEHVEWHLNKETQK